MVAAPTGATGDFSILANLQAKMNYGQLNKTPSADLKASIAAAVQAANAVPSSPIPPGAATNHMTRMTPAAPSPLTTLNTSRRDSDKFLKRVQPRPCDTTEMFNNLTQGMPFVCLCLFLVTFPY
jgi:hypothetical protein